MLPQGSCLPHAEDGGQQQVLQRPPHAALPDEVFGHKLLGMRTNEPVGARQPSAPTS